MDEEHVDDVTKDAADDSHRSKQWSVNRRASTMIEKVCIWQTFVGKTQTILTFRESAVANTSVWRIVFTLRDRQLS
jgi:hypothetical protein